MEVLGDIFSEWDGITHEEADMEGCPAEDGGFLFFNENFFLQLAWLWGAYSLPLEPWWWTTDIVWPLADVRASGGASGTCVNGVSPWTLLCWSIRSVNLKMGVNQLKLLLKLKHYFFCYSAIWNTAFWCISIFGNKLQITYTSNGGQTKIWCILNISLYIDLKRKPFNYYLLLSAIRL